MRLRAVWPPCTYGCPSQVSGLDPSPWLISKVGRSSPRGVAPSLKKEGGGGWALDNQGHRLPLASRTSKASPPATVLDRRDWALSWPRKSLRLPLCRVRDDSRNSNSSVRTSSFTSPGGPVSSRELASSRLQCNTIASSVGGVPRTPGPWHGAAPGGQLNHTGGRSGSSSLWLAGRGPPSCSWPDPAVPPGSGR